LLANKAPNIQLYYHLLLYPRKRLGCSKKEDREGKDPLSNPSSPQNLQVFKRGMRKKFLKGAKYSPSPFLHPYITTPKPYTTYYSPPTIQPIHMHILI
jgi:hypothetical protein